MLMAFNIFLLIVGFVLLIKGADFFVDGSSSVAKLIGIPGFVIGLTVVAMGTSAPEAAVSVTASLQGSNAIALGNIVGSNMFNLLVVAGFCAVMKPYKIEKVMLYRDFPINIVLCALLLVLMLIGNSLGLIDGIILLVGIVSYVAFVVISAVKNRDTSSEDVKTLSPFMSILCIIGGLAAVIFGGQLVVDSATFIAEELGWSETFIGLTIVAVGTSLPELVTSIVAARKGESGLALGNVIGSDIFNILFILGSASAISPIAVDPDAIVNVIILLCVTSAVYIPCVIKKSIGRIVGFLCVLGYVGYTIYLLMTTI
ncbi:MAG: calcium/sodium antiporter [Ruminococcaceae bacterium]|nr:calcium/sodium antiporter [Oscillospiraceae bacterium]